MNEAAEVAFGEATVMDVPELLRMMRRLALPFDERLVAQTWSNFSPTRNSGLAWLFSAVNEPGGYAISTLSYCFEYGGLEAFVLELYVGGEILRHGNWMPGNGVFGSAGTGTGLERDTPWRWTAGLTRR